MNDQITSEIATNLAKGEDEKSLRLNVIQVEQPIGVFFITSMDYKELLKICDFDIRKKIEGATIEEYIGVQRSLDNSRVTEISEFVKLPDASFPTSIIIAIDEPYVTVDDKESSMIISNKPKDHENDDPKAFRSLARILDGQHRLKGLEVSKVKNFQVNVTIFTGMDLSDQAMIFANVNLSQTKVNRSLAYDLQDYSKYKSPIRSAHRITVILNKAEDSPFQKKIKRLGIKTPGVQGETLTQAAVVEALLAHITHKNRLMEDIAAGKDVGVGKRESLFGAKVKFSTYEDDEENFVLRKFFIDERETDIAILIIRYFRAVKARWNHVWEKTESGWVLHKTNGFMAFMQFFKFAYKHLAKPPNGMIEQDVFNEFFEKLEIPDETFQVNQALPGAGGQRFIFNALLDASGLNEENVRWDKK